MRKQQQKPTPSSWARALVLLLTLSPTWADTVVAAEAGRTDIGLDDTGNNDAGGGAVGGATARVHHGQRQMDWIRAQGGFVHEHLEIRQATNDNEFVHRYALYAKDLIQAGELLLRIPRSCLIQSFDDDLCDTVQVLAHEMKLANASAFEPYVSYLQSQPYGQLPTMWSEPGKELLLELLGRVSDHDDERTLLPPQAATSTDWGCHSFDDPLEEQQAAMLLTQRGWDEVMIPVYDMMSHRNGEQWLNTMLQPGTSVHDANQDVTVLAKRDILPGDEIYTTYDQCEDCGGRSEHYGTPEIVRDYGFVELYPQKWIFHSQQVSFTLDESDSDTGELTLQWHSAPPSGRRLKFLVEQHLRLTQEFGPTHLAAGRPQDIPQEEWDLVVTYHQALVTALDKVLTVVGQQDHAGSSAEASTTQQQQVDRPPLPLEQQPPETANVDHGQRQMEWIRANGGYVSPKLEIRKLDPDNPQSSYGMFATDDIDETDLLLSIPRQCLVMTFDDDTCDTVTLLAQELSKGAASFFEPYTSYLQQTQPYGQLPGLWSETGKALLMQLVLEEDEEGEMKQVLPPGGLTDASWIGCRDFSSPSTPPVDLHAAMLVHQRGWDEVLIPVYDMMSHRNGQDHWLNTRDRHSVHDRSKPVQVEASRPIHAGDEIYTSYDSCLDCGARSTTYGTAEILRDYGFVEHFPQRWIFGEQEVALVLDYHYDDAGYVVPQAGLQVTFLDGQAPQEDDLDFFEAQIERLTALQDLPEYQDNVHNLPAHEWDTITQFHSALLTALTHVVAAVEEDNACLENTTADSCFISDAARYNALNEMFDDEGYNKYVCDIDWQFPEYESLEKIKSQYQKIYFIKHPEHDDVCFELDETWQICGCYRPHYHEYATHYAAQFLPEIKRVLWVGGGDSMLLHEIIKYDSLEIAIGLELDQKVTRGSFKHFGTQPHWDNDKVQWWYGDAAKSLLMLPKEYFGTFDLVLVDLSETVMANTVTEGLDIMAALALLLKEDGIFVKNEIYLEKLNQIFKHTMQLHVYDVPVLCSQAFIFGSNVIDFMKQNITDHGTQDNLVYRPLIDKGDYRYHEIHDYVMNPHPPERHCKDASEQQAAAEVDPVSQERSPGIVMILEAEQANPDLLQTPDTLLGALVPALERQGLSVVSSFSNADDDEKQVSSVTVVLKEGYVMARAWPEHAYCAFDLYLWSRANEMDEIKKALLTAVQSQAPSAFRIVAGGMFGVEGWQEDAKSRGPRFVTCPDDDDKATLASETTLDAESVGTIVEQNLNLLLEENVVAAVICGSEGVGCTSIDAVSRHKSVAQVMTFHTCPSLEGGVEYQQDAGNKKFACERDVLTRLQEELEEEEAKIGVIVLDASAEFAMAQVVHKISSRGKNRKQFFHNSLLVLAPMLDLQEEWRRVFVDKFRQIYRNDPLFRSEVMFNNTDTGSSMEMGTFLKGDWHYIQHMYENVIQSVEEASEGRLVGEARNFESGVFTEVRDPNPELFALPGHYDQRGPYAQWSSQKPLGHQVVVQMEIKPKRDTEFTKRSVKAVLQSALSSLEIETTQDMQVFEDLGDGCAVFAVWKGGSIVALWDGRTNLTLNLFGGKALATSFASEVQKSAVAIGAPTLSVMLRDEMPRGYGRVVNFASDIQGDPHWATAAGL